MKISYTCSYCGFSGQVVGGEDRDASPPTVTVYCLSCVNLQDVAAPGGLGETLAVPRCANGAGHTVRRWQKHHLCPRCLRGNMLPPDAILEGP